MIDVHQRLELPSGRSATYYSVPQLETLGLGSVSRLPASVRIVLEQLAPVGSGVAGGVC